MRFIEISWQITDDWKQRPAEHVDRISLATWQYMEEMLDYTTAWNAIYAHTGDHSTGSVISLRV